MRWGGSRKSIPGKVSLCKGPVVSKDPVGKQNGKKVGGLEFREQGMPEAASEVGRDQTMKDLARPWRGKYRDVIRYVF